MDHKPKLKSWVLPMFVGSIGVVIFGVLATYASTTVGALVVLIGVIAFGFAAWGASQSAD